MAVWVYTKMNALLLTITVLANFFQGISQKQYIKKNANRGTYIFNAVAILSAAILFIYTDTNGFVFDMALLPYVLVFALTYGSAMLFVFLSLKEGSFSFTNLIKSYALIMPTFYGSLFLNQEIGIWFWVGFVFLLVSIFLINIKKDDAKFSLRWCIYIVIAFLSNGMANVVLIVQQTKFAGEYKSEFMISAFLIVSIFFFALAFWKEKTVIPSCMKKGSAYAILMGLMNAATNLFLMILVTRKVPTSIIYPVLSGGVIVLSTIASVLFYKEKLTVLQRIGLACGVISIVFMNIK